MLKDELAFRENVSRLVNATPGGLEDLARDYCRRCFEPIFESPYLITREYAASLVAEMKEMGNIARKLPEREFFTMPSEMLPGGGSLARGAARAPSA